MGAPNDSCSSTGICHYLSPSGAFCFYVWSFFRTVCAVRCCKVVCIIIFSITNVVFCHLKPTFFDRRLQHKWHLRLLFSCSCTIQHKPDTVMIQFVFQAAAQNLWINSNCLNLIFIEVAFETSGIQLWTHVSNYLLDAFCFLLYLFNWYKSYFLSLDHLLQPHFHFDACLRYLSRRVIAASHPPVVCI